MENENIIIVVVTAVLTAILTGVVQYFFRNKSLIYKLDKEHKFEERKKVKDTLSKHKVHLLNACEMLNHRILNLYKNHQEQWHHVNGQYSKTRYYFPSSIYIIAHVYARIEILERELILMDTTIASEADIDFVKFLRMFRVILSDVSLYDGIKAYDFKKETDHLFRGSVDDMARALITKEKTISDGVEFRQNLKTYMPKLMPIRDFFDSISPNEERYRWDRLQALHYLTISFLNSYGYDFQKTSIGQFQKFIGQPRKCRVLHNYIVLLYRAKLNEQKEIRSFITMVRNSS